MYVLNLEVFVELNFKDNFLDVLLFEILSINRDINVIQ